MSSREKTYIALMCSLFLALTAVISVILYATRAMVVSTEVSSAQKQMSQLLAAVEYGFEPLDIFAVDWAEWDDSYAYLGGDMPEFVDVNIDDEWFRKVRMNYVGFFDVEGRAVLIWSDGLGAPTGIMPTGAATLPILEGSALTDTRKNQSGRHGIVMVDGKPLLMSAHTSLRSDGSGSSRGSIVVGRILDSVALRELGGIPGNRLEALDATGRSARGGEVEFVMRSVSATMPVHIALTRPHALVVYGLLLDPDQRPSGLIRAELESVGYGGAPQLIGSIICAILAFGLVWSATTFSLVERFALARMSWLKDAVSDLGSLGGHQSRLSVEYETDDEVSQVADEINALLDRLEVARRAQDEVEGRNRLLLDNMADAVFLLDLEGNVTFASAQSERLTGQSPDKIIGRHSSAFVSRKSFEGFPEPLDEPSSGRIGRRIEEVYFGRDGAAIPAELSISAVRDASGTVVATQWIARDTTEREGFEEQLIHAANHDHLTGLYNRRRLEEELARQLAESMRRGITGALLWLDLDDFKDVNDTLGHGVGDGVLIGLANALSTASRAEQTVARMGGDEFALLLPHASEEDAVTVAERLLEEIRSVLYVHNDEEVRMTTSIGIVMFPAHGTGVEELLSRADLAMYQAKRDGRNRVRMYEPGSDWEAEISERHVWARRIESAIVEGRLLAFAQPIVDARTGRTERYEMLVRLSEDDRIIAAGEFLPSAESLGLVGAIDRWMLDESIAMIEECKAQGRSVHLDLNLSGKSFGDPDMLRYLKDRIEGSGVDPSDIGFEVTETALIRNIGQATTFIRELRRIGCRFSLDDFGAGFSSFQYLRHLPIDILKIDGGLVRNLPTSVQDRHLVRALAELSHALGMQSVAECVEDEEILAVIIDLGVDLAQGYGIARPAPARVMLGLDKPSVNRGGGSGE